MAVGSACQTAADCGAAQLCHAKACMCTPAFGMAGSQCRQTTLTTIIGVVVAAVLACCFLVSVTLALQHDAPAWRLCFTKGAAKVNPTRITSQSDIVSGTGTKPPTGSVTRNRAGASDRIRSSLPVYVGLLLGTINCILFGILPFTPTLYMERLLFIASCLLTATETVLAIITMHGMLQMCVLIKMLERQSLHAILACGGIIVATAEGASIIIRSSMSYSYRLAVGMALLVIVARHLLILSPAVPVIYGLLQNYNIEKLRVKQMGQDEHKSWRGRFVFKAFARLLWVVKTTSISMVICLALSLPYLLRPATYSVQVALAAMATHCFLCHIEIMRLRGFRLPSLRCLGHLLTKLGIGNTSSKGGAEPITSSMSAAQPKSYALVNIRSHALAMRGAGTRGGADFLSSNGADYNNVTSSAGGSSSGHNNNTKAGGGGGYSSAKDSVDSLSSTLNGKNSQVGSSNSTYQLADGIEYRRSSAGQVVGGTFGSTSLRSGLSITLSRLQEQGEAPLASGRAVPPSAASSSQQLSSADGCPTSPRGAVTQPPSRGPAAGDEPATLHGQDSEDGNVSMHEEEEDEPSRDALALLREGLEGERTGL